MAKRKKEKALGHDPFAEMDIFDLEGPVPAAEPVAPPALEDPAPQTIAKPEIKPAAFTPNPPPTNRATGDNSGRAFSIADFLSSVNKKQEEAVPSSAVPEEAVSEEPAPEEVAEADTLPEEIKEAVDQDEPVISAVEEEQTAEIAENAVELVEEVEEIAEDATPFDLPQEPDPLETEEPQLSELPDWFTAEEEPIGEELEVEVASFDVSEEPEWAQTDELEPSPLPDWFTEDESEVDTAADTAETPSFLAEPESEEDEPLSEETTAGLTAEDLAVSDLVSKVMELEEDPFAMEEGSTELTAAEPAVSDLISKVIELEETEPAAEAEIGSEEDEIAPSEIELQGLLDTAELALAEEHRAALDALETLRDHDEDLDEDDEPEFDDESELDDEDDFFTDDEQTFDTVIDENNEVWGATAPLDPDLGMSWVEEEEKSAGELPNWLTADVSTIKLDTGMLQPIMLNEEDLVSDPDLHIDWEEGADEEPLPKWLTAETSALRIDTDKLKPVTLDETEDGELGVYSESKQAESESPAVEEPVEAVEAIEAAVDSEPSDFTWLEQDDDHLWHTAQLSPQALPEEAAEPAAETGLLPTLQVPFDDQPEESAEPAEDDAANEIDGEVEDENVEEAADPAVPAWITAHLKSSRNSTKPLDFPAPMEEDYTSLMKDSGELPAVSDQTSDRPTEQEDTAADERTDLPEDDSNSTAALPDMSDPLSLIEEDVSEADFDWAFDEEADIADFLAEDEVAFDFDLADMPESADSFDDSAADFDWSLPDDAADDLPAVASEIPADDTHLAPPTEELDATKLPDWLKTEDSFALFSDDAEEEEQLLTEDLTQEDTLPPVEPAFAEAAEPADESLEFLDEGDVFGFDFDFYKEEDQDAQTDTAAEIDIEFDDLTFNLDEMEHQPANPTVDLDDLLSKYSSLPTAQTLFEPLPDKAEPAEDDEPLGDVLDENLLFDFDFDQVDTAVEADLFDFDEADPFTFDEANPFDSFEFDGFDDDEEEIDVDSLLERYASPLNEPAASSAPAQNPPAANSTAPLQMSTPVETDVDPLTQLLLLIDSEMGSLPTAAAPAKTTPKPQPQTEPKPVPEPEQQQEPEQQPAEPAATPAEPVTADVDQDVDVDQVEEPAVEEYVVFKIAMTSYAIALDNVQEITPTPQTTFVPNVPSWVIGVTNLHGEIVSVVDVRRFLKLPWIEAVPEQRMLAVHDNRHEIRTGLLVDGVTAIKKLTPAEIEPLVSELNSLIEIIRPYASGRYQDIIILNLNELLMSSDMRQFEPTR